MQGRVDHKGRSLGLHSWFSQESLEKRLSKQSPLAGEEACILPLSLAEAK